MNFSTNLKKLYEILLNERNFKTVFICFWGIVITIQIAKTYLILPYSLSNEAFLTYYKFFTPDSYDWIINAQSLGGDSTDFSIRQPGFTLILKFLLNFNLLGAIAIISQFVFLGIIFLIYKIIENISKPSIKEKYFILFITLFLFQNYYLQLFANLVLSDYYAIFFICLSLYLIFKNKFRWSALSLGISWLFQNFAPVLLPFFALFVFFNKDIKTRKEKVKHACIYTLLFLLPNLPWFLYKYFTFGSPFFTKLDQAGLVNPNMNSMLYYAINGSALFGFIFIPVLTVILFKTKDYFSSKRLLLLTCMLAAIIFWTVIYEWNDRRFLLYIIPFFAPLAYLTIKNLKLKLYQNILILLLFVSNTIIAVPIGKLDFSLALNNWEILEVTPESLSYEGIYPLDMKVERLKTSRVSIISPFMYETYKFKDTYRKDPNTLFNNYKNIINNNYKSETHTLCLDDTKFYFSRYEFNNILKYTKGKYLSEVSIDKSCYNK